MLYAPDSFGDLRLSGLRDYEWLFHEKIITSQLSLGILYIVFFLESHNEHEQVKGY